MSEDNVIDLGDVRADLDDRAQELTDWIAFEAMCVKCMDRWWAVIPSTLNLRDMACTSGCEPGGVIDTGQKLDNDE